MAQLGRRSRGARYYEPYADSSSGGNDSARDLWANGEGATERASAAEESLGPHAHVSRGDLWLRDGANDEVPFDVSPRRDGSTTPTTVPAGIATGWECGSNEWGRDLRFGTDPKAEVPPRPKDDKGARKDMRREVRKASPGVTEPSVAPSKSRVLKRLGLKRARGTKLACLALVVIVSVCVAWGQLFDSGVTVTRSNEGVAMSQDSGASREDGGQSATGDAVGNSSSSSAGESGSGDVDGAGKEPAITVHVDGAVVNPGVYVLAAESNRVVDAIQAAGGLSADAETAAMNLAAPLSDGVKVHVPKQGEQSADTAAGAGSSLASSGASGDAGAAGSGAVAVGSASGVAGSGTSSGSSGVVNINTATAEELTALPGVGEATAKAIVEDRQKNGKFQSPEDLMRVSGIGQKKFAKLKDHIRV